MSEDIDKLQRMLEQATAAEKASEDSLDPETASLREAWIGFGRLLDAAEASSPIAPPPLGDGHFLISPLLLGEGQGVRAAPQLIRRRRRLLPMVALLAASLLIGIVTGWMLQTPQRLADPSVSPEQTASVDIKSSTLSNQPQWDDSLDEQIAQIGQEMAYAQQDSYSLADASGLVQYRMEQIQQDLEGNGL